MKRREDPARRTLRAQLVAAGAVALLAGALMVGLGPGTTYAHGEGGEDAGLAFHDGDRSIHLTAEPLEPVVGKPTTFTIEVVDPVTGRPAEIRNAGIEFFQLEDGVVFLRTELVPGSNPFSWTYHPFDGTEYEVRVAVETTDGRRLASTYHLAVTPLAPPWTAQAKGMVLMALAFALGVWVFARLRRRTHGATPDVEVTMVRPAAR